MQKHYVFCFALTALLATALNLHAPAGGNDSRPEPATRVVLFGAARDHSRGTHEYLAGLRVIAACLEKQPGVEILTIRTDRPMESQKALPPRPDVLVGFFYGQQVHADPVWRTYIDDQLARGAGFVLLHRALQGNGDAGRWIQRCAGAYHGESDRKYATVETLLHVSAGHSVARGLHDFRVRDEFYYRLKFLPSVERLKPILQADIDGASQTVAWAWQRPDGGRSFAFSGCHFHQNFELPEYRRLIIQAVLWTAHRPIPETGMPVDVDPEVLQLPAETQAPTP